MAEPARRSPVYNIVGVAVAGLIVIAAAALVMALAPSLKKTTLAEQLAATLKTQFPGTAPEVTGPEAGGLLRISLKVAFDPTRQWKQAQEAFDRASAVVEASKPSGVKAVEVTLVGVSVEGTPASMSRTLDYPGE